MESLFWIRSARNRRPVGHRTCTHARAHEYKSVHSNVYPSTHCMDRTDRLSVTWRRAWYCTTVYISDTRAPCHRQADHTNRRGLLAPRLNYSATPVTAPLSADWSPRMTLLFLDKLDYANYKHLSDCVSCTAYRVCPRARVLTHTHRHQTYLCDLYI